MKISVDVIKQAMASMRCHEQKALEWCFEAQWAGQRFDRLDRLDDLKNDYASHTETQELDERVRGQCDECGATASYRLPR